MERDPLLGAPRGGGAWRLPVTLAAMACLFLYVHGGDRDPLAAAALETATTLARREGRAHLALNERLACAARDAPGFVADAACASAVEPWACDDSCSPGTWCGELCGDACHASRGGAAPCIYEKLGNLSATCASLEVRRAPDAAAARRKPVARHVVEETCGSVVGAPASRATCDAAHWCDHCAPSDDCAALVPVSTAASPLMAVPRRGPLVSPHAGAARGRRRGPRRVRGAAPEPRPLPLRPGRATGVTRAGMAGEGKGAVRGPRRRWRRPRGRGRRRGPRRTIPRSRASRRRPGPAARGGRRPGSS